MENIRKDIGVNQMRIRKLFSKLSKLKRKMDIKLGVLPPVSREDLRFPNQDHTFDIPTGLGNFTRAKWEAEHERPSVRMSS